MGKRVTLSQIDMHGRLAAGGLDARKTDPASAADGSCKGAIPFWLEARACGVNNLGEVMIDWGHGRQGAQRAHWRHRRWSREPLRGRRRSKDADGPNRDQHLAEDRDLNESPTHNDDDTRVNWTL